MADISIIIPVYNGEKYIKKCLDSVINQTKKEIEIIVINDGSTDNTEECIKLFNDDRIKYFKNTNHGIGYSRNYGISKSRGKYIMFLDSDDYMSENECELLYKKCIEEDLDISICDFYKVSGNSKEKVNLPDFESSSLKENPNIITEYLNPWGKIFSRKMLIDNNIKFVENLKYEDAPFLIEALCSAKKIGKVNENLHYYVIHNNSETTVRDRRCFDILKIINKIRKYTKSKEYLKDRIDKLTVRIITNYTIQQRMQPNKKDAMDFIDEAFDYLKKEVPDYKNNKYYENRGKKRIIEKSKFLTKLYVKMYRRKKWKIYY